jgi:hypothetical protein
MKKVLPAGGVAIISFSVPYILCTKSGLFQIVDSRKIGKFKMGENSPVLLCVTLKHERDIDQSTW